LKVLRFIRDVHHVHHSITHVPDGSPRGKSSSTGIRQSPNNTSNDLRRCAFGKNDGHNHWVRTIRPRRRASLKGRRTRITGWWNPSSKGAFDNSIQIPLILIVSMWFGVHLHSGLPTECYTMYNTRSLLYYSPLCMPVWRQIGTKYVCKHSFTYSRNGA